MPAGTKNEAIQTSNKTAARTVNAVGNLNLRGAASGPVSPADGGAPPEAELDAAFSLTYAPPLCVLWTFARAADVAP